MSRPDEQRQGRVIRLGGAALFVFAALAAGPACQLRPASRASTDEPATEPETATVPGPASESRFPAWYLVETDEERAAREQKERETLRAAGHRCEEGLRQRLFVDYKGSRIVDVDNAEAMQMPGSRELEGRPRRLLPLDALLTDRRDVQAVEVVPCSGEPIVIERARAENVGFMRNNKGALKLVDVSGDRPTPMLRNIESVRLVVRR